jgi:hypothetical protein
MEISLSTRPHSRTPCQGKPHRARQAARSAAHSKLGGYEVVGDLRRGQVPTALTRLPPPTGWVKSRFVVTWRTTRQLQCRLIILESGQREPASAGWTSVLTSANCVAVRSSVRAWHGFVSNSPTGALEIGRSRPRIVGSRRSEDFVVWSLPVGSAICNARRSLPRDLGSPH